MSGVLWALLGGLIALGVGLGAWWLLIETEGVYLGQRVVVWLYDVYAGRYDGIKQFDPHHEFLLLAVPLMNELRPQTSPLILDVATGTGRLPLAMLAHSQFTGRVIGVDLSRRMLAQAASKLGGDLAHVDLLHAPAVPLPFDPDTFDAVTFLEALEFVDDPHATLAEAVRVLRPGGVLLTTLRINVATMPGKLWSQEQIKSALDALGMTNIRFEPWQEEYMKVWARKPGKLAVTDARPLEDVLRCPTCGQVALDWQPPQFVCERCGQAVRVGQDGVIELAALV